ncbi:MAG: hypothetical protein ACYDA0_06230 [Candidatus Dormibacteraceae bacterium]
MVEKPVEVVALERFNLTTLSPAEVVLCGAGAARAAVGAQSLEDAAYKTVQYLYSTLWDPSRDRPATALVRFYRTINFADLDPSLQGYAASAMRPSKPWPSMKCFTLLGTAGELPEWNRRQTSAAHRAIPLSSRVAIEKLPMVSRLIRDLGVSVDALVDPPVSETTSDPGVPLNVFYVQRAEGHRSVPDQRFVREHGIQSVVAFGGSISTSDLWTIIIFTQVELRPEVAGLFRLLALDVSIAVRSRLRLTLFAAHPPRRPGAETGTSTD